MLKLSILPRQARDKHRESSNNEWRLLKQKTAARFVGSASDGEFGVAAQTLDGSSENEGGLDVDANKSWLMFDSVIACRGFTAADAVTTIEQSNLRGSVL
jgi:hypothetical protein